jgi:ectoine hydroxylase-related dioxygenase (phytanoyl-CoA dioxygenase family)
MAMEFFGAVAYDGVGTMNHQATTLAEHTDFFRTHGYTIVENAVDAAYLSELQRATEHHREDPRYQVAQGRNLLAIDPIFENLIDGHAGMPILEALIPDLQMLAMDIRACYPGGGAMAWHTDIDHFSGPSIVSINTALYLDNLTAENGALRVLPRSHLTPFTISEAEQHLELPGEVMVQCQAGTMVLFQDTLWHRTGMNTTDRQRRGLFIYYGHFWMKQCYYPGNPVPFPSMRQYIDGKGAKRAQLLGSYRENSEFNRAEYFLESCRN